MVELRPYQRAAIDALREHVRGGKRRLCLVAPTGSGKTVIAAELLRGAVARGKRVLFAVHRRELLHQSAVALRRVGLDPWMFGAGSGAHPMAVAHIGSIPVLARRELIPRADVVILDEAHHAASPTWRRVMERYADAIIIGCTATPFRSDKQGLADLFEVSVIAATPSELIDGGSLVPYDAFAYDAPELHEVKITAGDYNQKDLGIACNTAVLVGAVVAEYLAHAHGRPALLFPVDVKHSRALCDEFRRTGVAAEHLDCKTPANRRDDLVRRFRGGDIAVLSSVGVLTEGFDAPRAEVAILARPTQSEALHLQMIGRVLRPAPGKERALIHDHAGNLLRLGLPDEARDFGLAPTPKRIRDLLMCPLCRAVIGRPDVDGRCKQCHEIIAPPREQGAPDVAGRADKVEVSGERINMKQIAELRARRGALGLARELTDAQLARAARATREERAGEFKRLVDVATRKGFKPGFAAHQYRAIFTVWPKFTEAELSVPAAIKPFFPIK